MVNVEKENFDMEIVSYLVTQRSSPKAALRDDTKNRCVGAKHREDAWHTMATCRRVPHRYWQVFRVALLRLKNSLVCVDKFHRSYKTITKFTRAERAHDGRRFYFRTRFAWNVKQLREKLLKLGAVTI